MGRGAPSTRVLRMLLLSVMPGTPPDNRAGGASCVNLLTPLHAAGCASAATPAGDELCGNATNGIMTLNTTDAFETLAKVTVAPAPEDAPALMVPPPPLQDGNQFHCTGSICNNIVEVVIGDGATSIGAVQI